MGLGSEPNQICAVAFPSKIDHYVTEMLGVESYGRYMDDSYCIHESKEYLHVVLMLIERECEKLGITVNRKKTRIVKLSRGFVWLKKKWSYSPTGKMCIRDRFINALFVGESEIEDQGCKGVCELTFVCFAPFFYGERHDVALSGSTAFKVRGGVGAVSYTHLDVYKRQVYPDAVAAPVVTKGFPKNEQPFYVAVDEIVTDAQPGKGASTGQAEMEFSANVWVCARHADLVKAANTAMSYADAVIALSLIHI